MQRILGYPPTKWREAGNSPAETEWRPDESRRRIPCRPLGAEFLSFLKDSGLGKVYVAPVDVLLSPHDIVQPDLVFVSKERSSILTRNNIQGAPDLLVEILSDSTRKIDEGIKLRRYERFGVREYWLIDPRRQSVRIYRLTESGFQLAARLAKGDALSTPLLPGLAISVADMFGYSSSPSL